MLNTISLKIIILFFTIQDLDNKKTISLIRSDMQKYIISFFMYETINIVKKRGRKVISIKEFFLKILLPS